MTAKELLEALERTGACGPGGAPSATVGTNVYTRPVFDLVQRKKDASADEAIKALEDANNEANPQVDRRGFFSLTLDRARKLKDGHPEEHFLGKPPPTKAAMTPDVQAMHESVKLMVEEQRAARETAAYERGAAGPPNKKGPNARDDK
jgi:hypothetical protein